MTEMANMPIILNLAGELSEELRSFFALKQFRVVNPLEENTILNWTHILVKDEDDFDKVGDTYGTLDNDIKIIALSQPRDLKNFMLNNGKMVFDESWLLGPFGSFILDKFFQEYGGVNLGDNYPKFKENGTFNITNPFNTGEYLDHLVYNAFECGMSALSIKTYFDHLLMYVTSLKNKGRVGFPVEVSYGAYGDVYGVQLHFYSGNLQIEDVSNSLSSGISKSPEEYLLYVALNSSDFFDFTYIPEVKKVVITGLWNRDESVKTMNKGFMFTVSSAENIQSMAVTETAAPFILNEGTIEDISSMVSPAGEEVQIIPAEIPETEEEFVQVISGSAPEEEEVRIIPAHEAEEEQSTVVKGGVQEKESVSNVKGQKEEQDKTVTKISGAKTEKDNFKLNVSSGKEEKKGNLTVRSLGGTDAKSSGMFDFSDKSISETGTGDGAAGKKGAALFKVGGNSKREEELDKKLTQVLGQNDDLKAKLVTLMNELKAQKETQAKLKKVSEDAAKAAGTDDSPSRLDELLKSTPSKAPSERESKMADEFRDMERANRKLQLEASQKEMRFGQEIEKLQRMVALKDTAIEKTRETTAKLIEKKDEELLALQAKLEQVNKHMAGGGDQAQKNTIKELERQSANQTKMIEMYKNKITNLSAAIEASKGNENSKDDARKLQLNNDQLKIQAESLRKEISKLQDRSGADQTQILTLKQEKSKLTDALKKAEQATRAQQNAAGGNSEVELKRVQGQVQLLETYLKEANTKVRDLEIKLQNATAVSRNNSAAEDGQSKAKIGHLENSVKKLTQDLVESRNQQAELKKETNKLRQEKTALQNTLDKAKKDMEKYEKKPASGKKAS